MKKTVYFILVALLMVLGVAKTDVVSAQGNENLVNPGSLQRTVPMVTYETYNIPLICDGLEVDRLKGVVEVFCRMHYEDGKIVWMIHNFNGILTSKLGEVFELSGVRKIDSVEKEYTFRANIKGDQGSHFILLYTVNLVPPTTFTIEKAICPGNDN